MSNEEKLYLRCLAQVLTQDRFSKDELIAQFSFTDEKSNEIIQRMIDDEFIKKRTIRKKYQVFKNEKTSLKLDEIMKLLPMITDTIEEESKESSNEKIILETKKRKYSVLESSQDPYEFSNSKISTTIFPIEQLNKKVYRNIKKIKPTIEDE